MIMIFGKEMSFFFEKKTNFIFRMNKIMIIYPINRGIKLKISGYQNMKINRNKIFEF